MSDNRYSHERPPIGINSLPFWFASGGSVEDSLPVLAALLPGYRGVLSLETRIPNADRNLMLAQLRFLNEIISS